MSLFLINELPRRRRGINKELLVYLPRAGNRACEISGANKTHRSPTTLTGPGNCSATDARDQFDFVPKAFGASSLRF